ncbi:MAG: HEAT repeat domain-containing protein [Victivallaceae bacterium]
MNKYCIALLGAAILLASFNFTYAQNSAGEERDIEAWDKGTDIYTCMKNLKSEDDRIFEDANECLYYLIPRHSAALLKELDNKEPVVRSRLAMLFGKRRMKEAMPAIIKLLDDKDISVRKSAVYALSDMKDVGAIPALMKLIHENDWLMQNRSISTLLELQDSVSKEDLNSVKKVLVGNLKHPKEIMRESAVTNLEAIRDPSLIPIIEELSRNDTYFYMEDTLVNGKQVQRKIFPVREAAVKTIEKLKKYSEERKKQVNDPPASTTAQ